MFHDNLPVNMLNIDIILFNFWNWLDFLTLKIHNWFSISRSKQKGVTQLTQEVRATSPGNIIFVPGKGICWSVSNYWLHLWANISIGMVPITRCSHYGWFLKLSLSMLYKLSNSACVKCHVFGLAYQPIIIGRLHH